MAVYRQVHTTFWQDPEIFEYTPEEKYFYLYLMTNHHTTQCGIYEISPKLMSIELGYPIDRVSILVKKFIDRGKILYSEDTRELFLLNWLKYNSLKSPKVMGCVEKELKQLKNKAFLKVFHTLCIQYGYPIDRLSIDLGEEEEKEEEKEVVCSGGSLSLLKYMEARGFPFMSPINIEKLNADIEIYTEAEVKKAIDIADENGKHSYAYVKGILEKRRAGVNEKFDKQEAFRKAAQEFLEDDSI